MLLKQSGFSRILAIAGIPLVRNLFERFYLQKKIDLLSFPNSWFFFTMTFFILLRLNKKNNNQTTMSMIKQ